MKVDRRSLETNSRRTECRTLSQFVENAFRIMWSCVCVIDESLLLQVRHRDVCALGFTDELNGCADAVFLDLPAPHDAVPHAVKALKDSGEIIAGLIPDSSLLIFFL